ncbi:hypothetical protein V6R21_24350 [Limibacter armeniacum]|uniref:hypothetical protein n=1 Tax=Limibacter armeniacum TaxID=466084 RepID=UPI002FE58CFF
MYKIGLAVLIVLVGLFCQSCISKRKAQHRLKEVLKEDYDDIWKVVEIERFFNEGNMNPNMFVIVLADKDNEQIQFHSFWDAKTGEFSYGYRENSPTLRELYEDAVEEYEMEETIRKHMGNSYSNIQFSTFNIKITLDIDPDKSFMLETSKKLCAELENFPEAWANSVKVIFLTPSNPKGLYYVYITPDVSEALPDAVISRDYIPYSFHLISGESDMFQQLTAKVTANFNSLVNQKTDNKARMINEPSKTWLNQENLKEFYAIYYIEKIPEKQYQYSPYVGYLIVKYEMESESVSLDRVEVFEQLDFSSLFHRIEQTLPPAYQTLMPVEMDK